MQDGKPSSKQDTIITNMEGEGRLKVAVDGVKGALGGAAEKLKTLVPGASAEMNSQDSTMRNRAGESQSPYVRGHKDNPVAWQLWGDDAIARAKKDNKLLFVSIGYSACHCMLLSH